MHACQEVHCLRESVRSWGLHAPCLHHATLRIAVFCNHNTMALPSKVLPCIVRSDNVQQSSPGLPLSACAWQGIEAPCATVHAADDEPVSAWQEELTIACGMLDAARAVGQVHRDATDATGQFACLRKQLGLRHYSEGGAACCRGRATRRSGSRARCRHTAAMQRARG